MGGGDEGGNDGVAAVIGVVVGEAQCIGEVCSDGGEETHNARNSV